MNNSILQAPYTVFFSDPGCTQAIRISFANTPTATCPTTTKTECIQHPTFVNWYTQTGCVTRSYPSLDTFGIQYFGTLPQVQWFSRASTGEPTNPLYCNIPGTITWSFQSPISSCVPNIDHQNETTVSGKTWKYEKVNPFSSPDMYMDASPDVSVDLFDDPECRGTKVGNLIVHGGCNQYQFLNTPPAFEVGHGKFLWTKDTFFLDDDCKLPASVIIAPADSCDVTDLSICPGAGKVRRACIQTMSWDEQHSLHYGLIRDGVSPPMVLMTEETCPENGPHTKCNVTRTASLLDTCVGGSNGMFYKRHVTDIRGQSNRAFSEISFKSSDCAAASGVGSRLIPSGLAGISFQAFNNTWGYSSNAVSINTINISFLLLFLSLLL
ncbi:hypothetical protein BDR26DRAFT_874736 [Obelidium mucronatum]|nr:hypothetical protein BDR26DRAFT_874736 [Obelidium mucronatum]